MFTKTIETLKAYPTNLTDNQYYTMIRIINDNRKRKHSLKGVFDAIFYLLKTGCQWRMLPSDFPKWERVYYYFQKWSRDGTLEEIHEVLRNRLRVKRNKNASPSVGLIDSQSIKTTKTGGKCRGIDGGYRGELVENTKKELGYDMVITLRTDKSVGFKPLPKRWIVERSFAWLEDFRRLAKDYERTVRASQNMIYLAFISMMMKWL